MFPHLGDKNKVDMVTTDNKIKDPDVSNNSNKTFQSVSQRHNLRLLGALQHR